MPINHPSFGKLDDDRIIIFDTTLRDGEQSPGFSMNLNEKIRMAEALTELGVDVMEAGFPIASPGRFRKRQGDRRNDRPARRQPGDRQPGPRRRPGRDAPRRRAEEREAQAHPHRHRHQRCT
jgi:isopropylmalate/homocitrate/citramalate synthase